LRSPPKTEIGSREIVRGVEGKMKKLDLGREELRCPE